MPILKSVVMVVLWTVRGRPTMSTLPLLRLYSGEFPSLHGALEWCLFTTSQALSCLQFIGRHSFPLGLFRYDYLTNG